MKINVQQTIYVGTIEIDELSILVALNDGDEEAVLRFIDQHSAQLDKAEVISQSYMLEE